MKNNSFTNKFYSVYLIGFFIILFLPMVVMPPWFLPPDWGKTILFKSILSVLVFLFTYQFLFKKGEIILPDIYPAKSAPLSGATSSSAEQFDLVKNNSVRSRLGRTNGAGKIIWILAAFFITIILATLFSMDVNFSLWGSPYRAGGAINLVFYIIFGILTFFIIKGPDWNKIINFSIFVGILVCFVAIIQLYGLFSNVFIPVPGRPPSTMGNPIMLAVYLLLLLFITFSFAIKEKRWNYKLFYYFAVLLFLYIIFITGSRAAYLGLLLGGLYFTLFYPVRNTARASAPEGPVGRRVAQGRENFSQSGSSRPRFIRIAENPDLAVSNGAYPKKLLIAKLAVIIALILGIFTVYYVNSQKSFPQFLENNKVFRAVHPRLSLKLVTAEPRFSAWKVGFEALKEKPIWGWGPENFAIGFDKYYDPSLPYISKAWGGWWDKAHNIFLDIAVTAGIPALIVYLTLLVALFWQMSRFRKNRGSSMALPSGQKTDELSNDLQITAHGIQATIIAYLVTNIFSFDAFASYLVLFLLIGYSLHLISANSSDLSLTTNQNNAKSFNDNQQNKQWKKVIISFLFILLIVFLWQYNLKPLQINAQIQEAKFLSESKKCDRAFNKMDKILLQNSFLDAYMRIKYIEYIKTCAEFFPEKNLEYAEKGIELMKEAVKIRPMYSRLWLFLGGFTTVKANAEQNPDIKESLVKEANSYFDKAGALAPKHQEVLVERAKLDMIAGNYKAMKEKSEKCITLDPSLGDCYWMKALSEIYLKDFNQALIDMKMAGEKRYKTNSISSLHQLVNAYAFVKSYEKLVNTYKQLIEINPNVPQYHSSLAFTYAKMAEYKKAREEAFIFLQLMPEAKDEVNAFLQTLPY